MILQAIVVKNHPVLGMILVAPAAVMTAGPAVTTVALVVVTVGPVLAAQIKPLFKCKKHGIISPQKGELCHV